MMYDYLAVKKRYIDSLIDWSFSLSLCLYLWCLKDMYLTSSWYYATYASFYWDLQLGVASRRKGNWNMSSRSGVPKLKGIPKDIFSWGTSDLWENLRLLKTPWLEKPLKPTAYHNLCRHSQKKTTKKTLYLQCWYWNLIAMKKWYWWSK